MKKYISLEKVLELMAVDVVRSGKYPSLPVGDPLYEDIDQVDIADGSMHRRMEKAYVDTILPCMRREKDGEVVSVPCEPAEHGDSINFRYGVYFILYSVDEPWVDDFWTTEIHIKDFYTYQDLKSFVEEKLEGVENFSVYALVDFKYRKVDCKADYNIYTHKWSNFSIPLFEQ